MGSLLAAAVSRTVFKCLKAAKQSKIKFLRSFIRNTINLENFVKPIKVLETGMKGLSQAS